MVLVVRVTMYKVHAEHLPTQRTNSSLQSCRDGFGQQAWQRWPYAYQESVARHAFVVERRRVADAQKNRRLVEHLAGHRLEHRERQPVQRRQRDVKQAILTLQSFAIWFVCCCDKSST